MADRLAGKVALVTGAARGIGAAIATEMAREGAHVFVTDLRADEGANLVAGLHGEGLRAAFAVQDVTLEAGWEDICATVVTTFGSIDIIVNNAGIVITGTIEDQTFSDWRKTMAVNLDAVFLGTRAGVRAMKQRGGTIINVSSIEGIVGNPFVPAYNASKGGVRLLTKSAALHCARSGYPVRINSLHRDMSARHWCRTPLPISPPTSVREHFSAYRSAASAKRPKSPDPPFFSPRTIRAT